ncbi:MAG: anion permease, partial [Candidatus Eremiobacteraeota bacterium]|nr:anion permease [Candidatus Eremiobacteraeota bacterium]
LAELARREGLFDWVAASAVAASGGSRFRLFALVYGACVVVTVVLSNDATAVVLTPAVAAAVRDAKAAPLPHLFACAFVANAASFVLPISNPANLVVFAGAMPALPTWLATFALPSVLAIVATFAVLAAVSRDALRGDVANDVAREALHAGGKIALAAIGAPAVALLVASSAGAPLGATTFCCGVVFVGVACLRDRTALGEVARGVSWTIVLLVASLFVMASAVESTGLLAFTRHGLNVLATWPGPLGSVAAAVAAAIVSNLANNLPAGLVAGASVASLHGHAGLRSAVAIGIDLGPNLSVTGSLATVLWLAALRREKIEVSAWTFLRTGALVMPPALLLAAASAGLFAR